MNFSPIYPAKCQSYTKWHRLVDVVMLKYYYSLGGNAHRILLQNEPIFTKLQENTHSEGKQI